MGTLLCFSKDNTDGLHAKVPKLAWYSPTWQPSPLAQTMAGIAAKCAGEDPIMINLAPRNIKICKLEAGKQPSTNDVQMNDRVNRGIGRLVALR